MKTCLENMRALRPLIHNITNYVTVNDVANALWAIGASPIMADDAAEVEDITSICAALRDSAVVVPSKALTIDKGAAFIFVVRPDSVVEKRFIETGPEIGNNIIVERGLAAGENIVVEGFHKLRHGAKVAPETTQTNDAEKTTANEK